jgi:hypothetical protein
MQHGYRSSGAAASSQDQQRGGTSRGVLGWTNRSSGRHATRGEMLAARFKSGVFACRERTPARDEQHASGGLRPGAVALLHPWKGKREALTAPIRARRQRGMGAAAGQANRPRPPGIRQATTPDHNADGRDPSRVVLARGHRPTRRGAGLGWAQLANASLPWKRI